MHITRLVLILAVAALLGACSNAPQTPATQVPTTQNSTGEPTAAVDSAYPAPATEGAYPGPEGEPTDPAVSNEPIVVPQPSSSSVGVVHGLLFQNTTDGQRTPVAGYTVYLGKILKNTEGVESVVEVNPSGSPKSIINGLGQFVFADVPPGRYGLLLETGAKGQLLLNDPQSGGNFIIEVTGGDTRDLGELAYALPEL